MTNYIAKIDRPIGTIHHGTVYPINYGYIEDLSQETAKNKMSIFCPIYLRIKKLSKHSLENALLLFTEKMMLKINVY